MSTESFIIDGGGSDITVAMTEMNKLTAMEITAKSLVNGAVTDYTIKLDSFVHVKDQDRILITTPQ